MKKLNLISLVGLYLVVFAGFNLLTTHAQTLPTPGVQCSTPTEFVTIKAIPSVKYDTSIITVSKNTCVSINFVNEDVLTHDFTIDGVSGENGIEQVYIHLEFGVSSSESFNVTTPNTDVTFEFYCWQVGHKAAGMVGDFIVGAGTISESDDTKEVTSTSDNTNDSTSQGIELPSFNILIALSSVTTIVLIRTRVSEIKK